MAVEPRALSSGTGLFVSILTIVTLFVVVSDSQPGTGFRPGFGFGFGLWI